MLFPEISPGDWEWLKNKCADCAEAGPSERESIIASVGNERPDLLPTLEALLADYSNGGEGESSGHPFSPDTRSRDTWGFPLSDAERPTFEPGEAISDRYLVQSYVGRGGMGELYEVTDRSLPARGSIALKTIRSEMAASRGVAARFEREIRNSLTVTHRNVCRMYDVGRHAKQDSTVLFLTMEYIPGGTLAGWMKERDVHANPVPEAEALHLFRQMAAGLAAIHAAGVIHRDFKPANVMLAAGEHGYRAVITDFGLSRRSAEGMDSGATQAGLVIGTVPWMAPEQFTLETPPTSAIDVYALGVTVYEMLTGVRYPLGAPFEELRKVRISPWLRDVVERCLARDPAKRLSDAGAVVTALDAGPSAVSVHWFSRRRLAAGIAAVAVVTVALSLLIWRNAGPVRLPAEQVLMQRGSSELYDNSFFDASRTLQEAVKLAPHDSFAHAMLAIVYDRLEMTARANRELLKATGGDDLRHASSEERLLIEGVHLTMARDYAGAAREFRHYADKSSRFEKSGRLMLLGHALELAQKPAEATSVYEANRDNPSALVSLAALDAGESRIPKAKAEFEEALGIFRKSRQHAPLARTQFRYGLALNGWGEISAARDLLNSCVQEGTSAGDSYDAAQCKRILGEIALQRAQTDQDLTLVENAFAELANESDHQGFQAMLGWAYMGLGQVDVRRLDFKSADLHFREAGRRAENEDSGDLRAQVDLLSAGAHNRSSRAAEAEVEARRALAFYELQGSTRQISQCRLALGQSLRNQGRLPEAITVLEGMKEKSSLLAPSDRFQLRFAVASVYAAEENQPAALLGFQEAMKTGNAGNEAYTLMPLARAQISLGAFDEARKTLSLPAIRKNLSTVQQSNLRELTATLELYSGFPAKAENIVSGLNDNEARMLLGLTKVRAGKTLDGIAICRTVLESGQRPGTDSRPRLCLLEGLIARKDTAGARAIYESIGKEWRPQLESAWKADALMLILEPSSPLFRSSAAKHIEDLRRVWGDAAINRYARRPDVQHELAAAGLKMQRS
jgi:tetratricopeptide (TPR) repeat protein